MAYLFNITRRGGFSWNSLFRVAIRRPPANLKLLGSITDHDVLTCYILAQYNSKIVSSEVLNFDRLWVHWWSFTYSLWHKTDVRKTWRNIFFFHLLISLKNKTPTYFVRRIQDSRLRGDDVQDPSEAINFNGIPPRDTRLWIRPFIRSQVSI